MKKTIMMILLAFLAVIANGCSKITEKIEVDEASVRETFSVQELNLSDIIIKVYSGNKSETIPLKEEYLPQEDREKLSVPGTHQIHVVYKNMECTFTIRLTQYGDLDYTSLANTNENLAIDAEGYYQVAGKKVKARDTYHTVMSFPASENAPFNYLMNKFSLNYDFYANMIDGLIEYDKYGNLVGALAKGYMVTNNEDGTQTWIIRLKENVKWVENESGRYYADVIADDFVAGIEYVLNPEKQSAAKDAVIGLINGAEAYDNDLSSGNAADFSTVGIKVISDYEIAYTLKKPTPDFLSSLVYSPFLPVNRTYLTNKGTAFGVTANDILVNGPFRVSEYVTESRIIYEKNQDYYDAEHVYVNQVIKQALLSSPNADRFRLLYEKGDSDEFTVSANDSEGYSHYVTGTDGKSGTMENPFLPECTSQISYGERAYFGYFNFHRIRYEYTDPNNNKTQQQNTQKALQNVNFRKGILYGLQAMEYLKRYNTINPDYQLLRSFTFGNKAVYQGKSYTDYLNDLFNERQNTSGKNLLGILGEGDPVYNESLAKSSFETAKTELMAEGLLETDFPIPIDIIADADVQTQMAQTAMYEKLRQIGNGIIEVRLNKPATANQRKDWVNKANFDLHFTDMILASDPETQLKTIAIGGKYAQLMGFTQSDQANMALENQILGSFSELLDEAENLNPQKTNERFRKMAAAEYTAIYEDAIIIPWRMENQYIARVSKVLPFQSFSEQSFTKYRQKNVIVLDTPVTKDLYYALASDYEENRK